MPDFTLERACPGPVAGIDEAGRGPWAGPVVAAAVILPEDRATASLLECLDDSKKLRKTVRERLRPEIEAVASFAIGIATPAEIDELNILQATLLAMRRACTGLSIHPASALVDGNRPPQLSCAVQTVVKGDSRSFSIAAASILAKTARDDIMTDLARKYPGYGWERNAGYGTKEHQNALSRLGVTPVHRRSFAPIRDLLSRYSD
jgi:ribonuclease HII